MNAKAKPARSRRTPELETLSAKATRALAGLAAVLAAVAALAVGVWRYAHQHLQRDPRYFVQVEHIELSPPPPNWIHTDLRRDALRDGSLELPLSILDPRLAEQVTQVFQLNPWVARVERVTKLPPARLEVRLAYRRPVCMVETPRGLAPVDIKGVLLPGDNFSPLESQNFPRVVGIQTAPLGPVGTAWGDPLVPGGATIAALLLDHWQTLGLRAIVPVTASNGLPAAQHSYDLYSLGGTRIVWGAPPGGEVAGESPAAEKLARLQKYAAVHGSLDGVGPTGQLDVRQEIPAEPRTAQQPTAAVQ